MAFDATTETIAHFIGHFHLSVEEARQRDQFLEFQAAQRAQEVSDALNASPFRVKTDYRLKDHDPKLEYRSAAEHPTFLVNSSPATPPESSWDVSNNPVDSYLPTGTIESGSDSPLPPGRSEPPDTPENGNTFNLPHPGSVASVIFQRNTLNDNDIFGIGAEDMAPVLGSFDAFLRSLETKAESLAGFIRPDMPSDEDGWQGFVDEALGAIRSTNQRTENPGPDANIHTLAGTAASGIIINGESATEVPVFKDLLPRFLRTDDPAEAPRNLQSEGTGEATTGQAIDGEITVDPDALPTTQTDRDHDFAKDFGGNVTDPWIVEPGHQVVAGANTQLNEMQVRSSWLDADVIAVQNDAVHLNAISQVNVMASGDVISGEVANAASNALNVAEIVAVSSVDPAAEAPDQAILPGISATVRIETNVTQVNWTQQYNFTTDNDTANVTLTGSNLYLGLGENTEYNETFLTETGYNFDLIMVGGNYFDITMLTQTNVLLDANQVEGTANVSAGDNLQYNLAQITNTGVDTEADLNAPFGAALDQLADGAANVTEEVEQDDLFAGSELLRVLYIDGDLTTVTVAEQTNVLGDVDQVAIAHAAVEAAANATSNAVEQVVVGSNAQANIAIVQEFGKDSVVMAGGESYSDALIHQAGLIDTDVMPDGVTLANGINDLVNEAVAFLSDDMLGAHITEATHAAINATEISSDFAGQFDVMQTVLG